MDILGIPIPAEGAPFLVALAIHVPAGLTAAVAGIGAAVTRKGSPRHVLFGRTYLAALLLVVVSMAAMSLLRWPLDAHLLVLGVVSAVGATVGLLDRRGARRDRVHFTAMGVSLIALLTAFYVDNGPHLPLWELLPAWAFWVLPSLVGGPIIAGAWLRRGRRPAAPGRV
jgi:hypothetical protein